MSNQVLKAILRNDFKSFVIKVFNEVAAGSQYMDNWHIDVICDEIMSMLDGKNNRLIINIPPRNMKSIICSVALPAYLLGKNPKTNIICVSYSDDLATKFANDCRTVIQSQWYGELFPLTKLKVNRRSINDFETTHGGGRMATSIGGTLTGRGADWIIIDDPLKPADAMSDTQREKVNDWYGSTLYSRLNDKAIGKILLVMQRLHQNDLTGFLLEADSTFKIIKLPIIAEQDEEWKIQNKFTANPRIIKRITGDLLHPEREDMNIISELRKSLGEFAFAGQYQQRPSPIEGGLIKKEWFSFYNQIPREFVAIFISWDTAEKTGATNAYSACIVIGLTSDSKLYIVEGFRERMLFPDLIKKIESMHLEIGKEYNVNTEIFTLIEDASSGVQAIQQLKRNIRIVSIKPESDKITRLSGISPFIESGKCLFPNNAGNWWKSFESELFTFPSCTFKDQCDALSQGIQYITKRFGIKPYNP